jgi:hypothetical protein
MATKKKSAPKPKASKPVAAAPGSTPVWGERNNLHNERSPHSKG